MNVEKMLEDWNGSCETMHDDIASQKKKQNGLKSRSGSIVMGSPNWVRMFELNSQNSSAAALSLSCLTTFTILRAYNNTNNEVHSITLVGLYSSGSTIYMRFINENSGANQFKIRKLRYVVKNNYQTYVDVYYSDTALNTLLGIVDNGQTSYTETYWKALENPYIVPETSDNETVKTVYEFSANRTIESRLAALEAAVASIT